MNWIAHDLVSVLWLLLPGFVAAWVFGGLTAYPRRSEFERVIQALIFTAFAQVLTYAVRGLLLWSGRHFHPLGEWDESSARVWSVLVAMALGAVLAWLANGDLAHKLLRKIGVTRQTGYPSEWFGAFKDRGHTYVVLHLTCERRLYGWPEEWPLDHRCGHFSMADAEWLEEGDPQQRIQLAGVDRILVPATEVSLVEFMKTPEKPAPTQEEAHHD